MADEKKKQVKKGEKRPQMEQARVNFRRLLLANPNYFGTLKASSFAPETSLQGNTTYEELTCVGYHPQLEQLEAVVEIKRATGYSGDICTDGSTQYVRFFLSYDNGATWEDQGVRSFTAWDIPGDKPLHYAVTLEIDPRRRFCTVSNLPRVRAILSWEAEPTAGDPDYAPVWGNVLEETIQIDALRFLMVEELLAQIDVELQPELLQQLDLQQTVALADRPVLTLAQRHRRYREKGVPAPRYTFSTVQTLLNDPQPAQESYFAQLQEEFLTLKLDLADILAQLLETDGDTRYEELHCIGLDPNEEALIGVLEVKQPNGYSGGLCEDGSKEYVAFWVDWDDGAGWTYQGTAAVDVHDIGAIPSGGLHYAVYLPVDLKSRKELCADGPTVVKMRAILSWETAPPTNNPNYVPTWGNREETEIHIPPTDLVIGTEQIPYLDSVGNMAVCDINPVTGRAGGNGVIANFNAVNAPFGGTQTFTGFITNAPNALAGAAPLKYRLFVRPAGAANPWQPVTNNFTVKVTEQNGVGLPVQYNVEQKVDGDGFYDYLEQFYPNQWRRVVGGVIGRWATGGGMTGRWEIRLEAKLPGGAIVPAGTILCSDGTSRSTVTVRLDQKAPSAAVAITGYSRDGGPVQPASSCGVFRVGDVLYGTYSSFDADHHFDRLTLSVAPSGGPVSPAAVSHLTVGNHGDSGTWTLDTGAMQACGYIIHLRTWDRTIVNSGHIGWGNGASAGFCLLPALEAEAEDSA